MAKASEAAAAAGAKAGSEDDPAAPAPATKKDPKPEGWVSPVAFAPLYAAQRGSDVRPQIVYGYMRNNKAFGEDTSICRQNTDGHWMINVDAGLAFLAERDAKRAASVAEKEAKAAAAAEAASE